MPADCHTPKMMIPQARATGPVVDRSLPWWNIVNKASAGKPTATINIHGIIGQETDWWTGETVGVSVDSFLEDLNVLDENTDLNLFVNSGGGEVFAGITIYNRLSSWKGNVTVTVEGLAASSASIITMAGDTIKMHSTAMLMIHNPETGAYGQAKDLRKAADILDTIRSSMMAAYRAKNPAMSDEDLIAALDTETWYTATLAKDAGFTDEIIEAKGTFKASMFRAQASRYQNVPADFLALVEADDVPVVQVEPPAQVVEELPADPIATLQEQVAALAAAVTALTAKPEVETPPAPVPDNSAAIANLRTLAKADGKEAAFVAAVAEGKSLDELRAIVTSASGDKPRLNTVAVTDPSAQPTAQAQAAHDPLAQYNGVPARKPARNRS